MSVEYAVVLDGHPFELEDLRTIFASGPIRVREIEVPPNRMVTALLASEFEDLPSDIQVLEIGRRLVRQVNGALFASDPDRSLVRMGAIHVRANGGAWGGGVVHASGTFQGLGRLRTRGHLVQEVGPDGSPRPPTLQQPRQAAWIALAAVEGDDANAVADVLNALSGEPDWFDLWKAEEVIHADRQAIANWPVDDVDWFRQTATRYRHSPSHRHGRKAKKWLTDAAKPEMGLEPARRLVAKLARAWLDWKAARRN